MCSSNFAIAIVVSLCLNFCMSFVDWFMASFLYCFPYSYRSSNCCSFTLLKALAKSNCNLFAIAFKSDKFKERAIKKSKKLMQKKDAKRIKSDKKGIFMVQFLRSVFGETNCTINIPFLSLLFLFASSFVSVLCFFYGSLSLNLSLFQLSR